MMRKLNPPEREFRTNEETNVTRLLEEKTVSRKTKDGPGTSVLG